MFDYIKCPPELLPDGFVPDGYPFGDDEGNFQSKSFECLMTNYRITPEGRLELQIWDDVPTGRWFDGYDWDTEGCPKIYVDEPEDKTPKMKTFKVPRFEDGVQVGEDDLEWPIGPYEETERQNYRWVEYRTHDGEPFSGYFNFYTNGRPSAPLATDGKWHEYTATFLVGQLVEIVDDSERVNRFFRKFEKGHNDEETT